jgi:hypothetical protein
METISTGYICLYGTTGHGFVSSLTPWNPRDYMKERQVENAGIEPATSWGLQTSYAIPHS